MSKLKHAAITTCVVLGSLVFTLALVEVGLRLVYLKDPWTLRNFSVDPINVQVSNISVRYDPVLGYIIAPNLRHGWSMTTGEMGVHLNATLQIGQPSPPLPVGGILAVGDSFTFGSEVGDNQSWPAYLEAILGLTVVNAGVGGYGIDQTILRAEQLLDIVKPRLIIAAFIPNCIGRNEYSVNGGLIKPYFDVENGKLELRNVPVPEYQPTEQHVGRARIIFGRFYTVAWVAERLGLGKQWLISDKFEYRTVHNKGFDVSCLIWKRLADRVASRKIPIIAFAEYAGIQVSGHDDSRKSSRVEAMLACATAAGVSVVDSYHYLLKQFETNKKTFWDHWVRHPHNTDMNTGHMSAVGNKAMAELLAEFIRTKMPDVVSKP